MECSCINPAPLLRVWLGWLKQLRHSHDQRLTAYIFHRIQAAACGLDATGGSNQMPSVWPLLSHQSGFTNDSLATSSQAKGSPVVPIPEHRQMLPSRHQQVNFHMQSKHYRLLRILMIVLCLSFLVWQVERQINVILAVNAIRESFWPPDGPRSPKMLILSLCAG